MVQARDEAGERAEFTGLGRQGPDMSPWNVGSEGTVGWEILRLSLCGRQGGGAMAATGRWGKKRFPGKMRALQRKGVGRAACPKQMSEKAPVFFGVKSYFSLTASQAGATSPCLVFKNHLKLCVRVYVCVYLSAFNLANWCLLNTNCLSDSDNSVFLKQPQQALLSVRGQVCGRLRAEGLWTAAVLG